MARKAVEVRCEGPFIGYPWGKRHPSHTAYLVRTVNTAGQQVGPLCTVFAGKLWARDRAREFARQHRVPIVCDFRKTLRPSPITNRCL